MKAPSLEAMEQAARSIYAQSNADIKRKGRAWYPMAKRQCQKIATRTGRTLECIIYACAALSPLQPWEQNIKQTVELAARRTFSNPGTFTKFARRAWDCLAGDLGALSGPKVVSFAMAISGNLDAIVIDRWVFRALGHHRESCTIRQYERMAQAIRNVAHEVGEAPSALQAIIWVAIRDYSITAEGAR